VLSAILGHFEGGSSGSGRFSQKCLYPTPTPGHGTGKRIEVLLEYQNTKMRNDSMTQTSSSATSSREPTLKEPLYEALELIDKDQLPTSARKTQNGIFFFKENLPALINAYQKWFSTLKPGTAPLTEDKILRKLLQTDDYSLSYLLEGKQCHVGYHFSSQSPGSSGLSALTKVDSTPLDARDFLHVRDPIFKELENAQVELNSQGFALKVKRREQDIVVSRELVLQFAALAKNSRRVMQRHPELNIAVRFAVPLMVDHLLKAKKLSAKDPLLLPAQCCNQKLLHLKAFGFLFVIQTDGKLLDCFEHSGKNLHNILTKEFDKLRSSLGKGKFSSLEPARSRRFLFFIKSNPERFSIEPTVFKQWIVGIRDSLVLTRELKSPFSLSDAILLLSKALTKGEEVQFYTLPGHLREQTSPRLRFRQYKDTYFVIESGSIIQRILFKGSEFRRRDSKTRPKRR